MGKLPEEFEYAGSQHASPLAFSGHVGLNPDDYVEVTSYTHHPFYGTFDLEVPDNWSHDRYYNVPLGDFVAVLNHALENGYSVVWDSDDSEPHFSFENGVAIIPAKKWDEKSTTERKKTYKVPEAEKEVSQRLRQREFDSLRSTDQHLMHITALVKDQNGTRYYRAKNSWGKDANRHGGYVNMSESYIRLRTVAVMVHRDAIPKSIARKLALKACRR